jgi:hypothetical protein
LASELVFVLKQEVDMYDSYQQRIAECDQQLQKHLATFANNPENRRSDCSLPLRNPATPIPCAYVGERNPAKVPPRWRRLSLLDVSLLPSVEETAWPDVARFECELHRKYRPLSLR